MVNSAKLPGAIPGKEQLPLRNASGAIGIVISGTSLLAALSFYRRRKRLSIVKFSGQLL
jgi:hypothetical protein